MWKLRSLRRGAFDVREGEHGRTVLMVLYFLFSLFALHILKPVSFSLFLGQFEVQRLPYLYLLIAVPGGVLAYVYTKIAVKTSLRTAVTVATLFSVLGLLAFWRLIDPGTKWLLYIFSLWVSLLGVVFVSQGWLVAANVFNSREAKRLYGLLGLGSIAGAAFGYSFTALTAERLRTTNLLPVSAAAVIVAWAALRTAATKEGGAVSPRKLDENEQAPRFAFRDLVTAITRYRHLLVIVGIISVTYSMEVLVEFQFLALARAAYLGTDQLTAFLGEFGVYLSSATFVLQLFTTLVVARLGVGGALKISPLATGGSAVGLLVAPSLVTAALTRLLEASTRYSVNRTAIELLYLPLPSELKNRTKAFVDVFVDRLGRGLAGVLLLLLTFLHLNAPWQLSLFIISLAVVWILLSIRARNEYVKTVRQRVESRRLDLEAARITVQDPETVKLLEQAARGPNPRQVLYALSLLYEAPGYDLGPLLREVANSSSPVVRAKVYELSRRIRLPGLVDSALAEIRSGASLGADLAREAAGYVLAISPDAERLAAELMNQPDCTLAAAALMGMADRPELVQSLVTHDWITAAAGSEDHEKRGLAASAIGIRGDAGTDAMHRLLVDPSRRVAAVACHSAGLLQNQTYLKLIVQHLAHAKLRGAALGALIHYGESISGTLGVLLEDTAVPVSIRRQIPRVLARLPYQSSVDTLQRSLGHADLAIRTAVLKALNRLREAAPELSCGKELIRQQIRSETQSYFELYAALTQIRKGRPDGKVSALLVRTLEEHLKQTIERLFRLLGLCYPPKQIYAAYLAVIHRRSEVFASALDFLDNILDRDLKDVLIPLLDHSPHLLAIGRETFGIKVPDLEAAIRRQLRSGDAWLAACAIACAAELRLKRLAPEVAEAAERGSPELILVARAASAALT